MKDEQALNEKLAKFAGLDFVKHDITGEGFIYRGEVGNAIFPNLYCDYFTRSLDACFKWLVPKAYEKLSAFAGIYFLPLNNATRWHVHIDGVHEKWSQQEGAPALAFCLAIEKLIDAEANTIQTEQKP